MNNLVKVSDLFNVIYGVNLELVNLTQCKNTDKNAMPFVSRTENNNGVSAYVEIELDVEPNPSHTLSVAGSGSVLSTFYHPFPYYSGRDLYVLVPKIKMSVIEMLFYAKCISANKYKYNYGRQANKTLKNILIPSQIPEVLESKLTAYRKELEKNISAKPLIDKKIKLEINRWKDFELSELFKIEKGERLTTYDRIQDDKNIPLIVASSENNGVVDFISQLGFISDKKIFEKKITIDMFWNVFYHDYKYFSDDNVHTLVPQFKTNKYISLFIVSILRKLNYKYSFGRQARINRIEKEKIKLPSKNGNPDFEYMEDYIKSLSYSSSI